MAYVAWRKERDGERNTALGEIGTLSMVLNEAVVRKHCQANVAANLRMKHDKSKEKPAWTDEEIAKVDAALKADLYGWMRTTFLLGRYQALRIAQCAVPLDCIDLERARLHYPDTDDQSVVRILCPASPAVHRIYQRIGIDDVAAYLKELGKKGENCLATENSSAYDGRHSKELNQPSQKTKELGTSFEDNP